MDERVREAAAAAFPEVAQSLLGPTPAAAAASAAKARTRTGDRGDDALAPVHGSKMSPSPSPRPAPPGRAPLAPPAVSAAARALRYERHLHDAFLALAVDGTDNPCVRASVAGSLPRLVRTLGHEAAAMHLRGVATSAMRSKETEVRDALFPVGPGGGRGRGGEGGSFDCVVRGFHVASVAARAEIYRDVLSAVLELESNLGHSWRHTAAVLHTLGLCADLFPADLVEDAVVPLAVRHLAGGVVPVRAAAADALCLLLRAHPRAAHRHDVCTKLVRNHAHARSCLARLAFVAVLTSALTVFSSRWIRESYFTAAAVELLSDRVPNVRLAAAGLLPRLKGTCRLAEVGRRRPQENQGMGCGAERSEFGVEGVGSRV